ncbi:MAG: ATP-binding protein, partial [Chitinophagaceae bacterium]|nr:ATP-binding protein [Chitinophagaceae bacterium]
HVQIEEQLHGLTLTVRDEGCGFDPNDVDDPTLPENIAKTGGRGIFLIKQLCDGVKYEANGTEVRMSFDF